MCYVGRYVIQLEFIKFSVEFNSVTGQTVLTVDMSFDSNACESLNSSYFSHHSIEIKEKEFHIGRSLTANLLIKAFHFAI